jgi:hypothetical protein
MKAMGRDMFFKFSPEPTAAAPSVCGCGRRFAAASRHRCSVSSGCGSALRWTAQSDRISDHGFRG